MQEINEKYKYDKGKLEEEKKKQAALSAKSMLGCLVTFLQLPILMTMWSVINKLSVSAGTMLIPWVASIKLSDSYFIVPLIYIFASLTPSLLSYISFFKIEGQVKMTKGNIIIMAVFGLFIAKAAPIAVGIYLITTSLFNFIEELIFRLYMKKADLV